MVAFSKNNYFGVTFSNSLLMVPHRMLQLCQRVFFVIFSTPSRFPSFSPMICVRTLFILLLLSGMTVTTCFKFSVFPKFGSFLFLMFNSISHSKRNLISLHTHVLFFKCCTSHDFCTFYWHNYFVLYISRTSYISISGYKFGYHRTDQFNLRK